MDELLEIIARIVGHFIQRVLIVGEFSFVEVVVILAVVIAVFWPLRRWHSKRKEKRLHSAKAIEEQPTSND